MTHRGPSRALRRGDSQPRDGLGGGSPALRAGHWRSLLLLEDTAAVRSTLAAYAEAASTAVYLRPTKQGLVVLSLDADRCRSMVGIGAARTRQHLLRSLPPSRQAVAAAADGYRQKVAALRRSSAEDRFALRCIGHALRHRLQLPGTGLLFVHQEWRLPDGGKIDLLAVDPADGQLHVIELKADPGDVAAAEVQARRYADAVHAAAGELAPFLTRLLAAHAAIYAPGSPVPAVGGAAVPAVQVWWPGGRGGR